MAENINLIPQYEVAHQTRLKVVRVSTLLSILLLLGVLSVSAYYYYQVYQVKQQVAQVDTEIINLRNDITGLSNIEINARILYAKSSTLQSILDTRIYYSKLLTELENSTPSDVSVRDFNMDQNSTINITGNGSSYNSIQAFINNLLANEVFMNVTLNSVGLDNNSENGVSYYIVVSYDIQKLYE